MQVRSALMWRPLLVALVLAGCGGAQEAATTTTETVPTTTVKRTTTTAKRTTTTEPFSALPIETQREFIRNAFAVTRDTFVEEVGANRSVRSVDKLDYVDETVVLAVSSDYRTAEINQDVAWDLTTDLRYLWTEDGPFGMVSFPVGLRLTVGDQTFHCPGEFMLALADVRADRTDWNATCR
jgi:hypothetical protein